ncbi:hypothetical protein DCC78_08920 [bacterium]|nr:MAG: hypothetical protein DCC78_08920 [bacterium]
MRFAKMLGSLAVAIAAVGVVACSPSTDTAGSLPAGSGSGSGSNPESSEAGPLLFTIGMHIEPLGPTAQAAAAQPSTAGKPGGASRPGPDYNNVEMFERSVADMETLAGIVEEHGGKMTIQAQSPFTTTAVNTGSTILSDLQDAGHEIGLHFHEDAHLGKTVNELGTEKWCEVMKEEIGFIHDAGVEGDINYWSGGNLYSHLLEAATCAGLSVNSDWKNPDTQQTDLALVGTVPWRPSGSVSGSGATLDTSAFASHDPSGEVIFLPEGNYDRSDFAASRRSEEAGGDEAYFEYLESQLLRSVETAVPGKVNVFHFTIHPGEFRGNNNDPFGVIERFLSEVVDPLVAEGKVEWATLSEMAAAFEEWEDENPGADPREGQDAASPAPSDSGTAAGASPTVPASTSPAAPASGGKPRTGKAYTGKVDRDVTYCTAGGTALKMDIYYPQGASGETPAVLYVHGGGWTGGSKSGGSGSETIPSLVAEGFLVAAVDYRLAPKDKWPAQIEDVKCAVRYLRANAEKYSIDADSIGAYGGSAGGHLVSMLGVTDGDEGFEGTGGWAGVSSRVQAVVSMFGAGDMTVEFNGASQAILTGVFGVESRPSEVLAKASPVTWASSDDPPFLLLHGEKDKLVPLSQSQVLHDALMKAGTEPELVVVKNAGHGFAPTGGAISPTRTEISAMIAAFFAEHLK